MDDEISTEEEQMCPETNGSQCWISPVVRALEREQIQIKQDLNALHDHSRKTDGNVDALTYRVDALQTLVSQEDQRSADLNAAVRDLERRMDAQAIDIKEWFTKIDSTIQAISIAVSANRVDDVTRWNNSIRQVIQVIGIIGATGLMLTGSVQVWSYVQPFLGLD